MVYCISYFAEYFLYIFLFQIANGMKYLSSKSYIHRDLRTMNILLTQTFEVKVGGLNLCTDINNSSIETGKGRTSEKKGKIPLLIYKQIYL